MAEPPPAIVIPDECLEETDPTLLISCLQGGLGDGLLVAWLVPRLWQCSGLTSAIAVLPQKRPTWMRKAFTGITIWQMHKYWPPDDPIEIERYDRLVSAAAYKSDVCRVETLGPNSIPSQGTWPRNDEDLYSRLQELEKSEIYPECPVPPANSTEIRLWLEKRGLLRAYNLVIIHARNEKVYPYKNPSPHRVCELVENLLQELRVQVVLLGEGGPSVDRYRGRYIRCTEHLRVPLLAGLLSRASVLIGGDSGPRHLAGMVGTPIVTFDLPTDRKRGPFVPANHVLRVPACEGGDTNRSPFDFDASLIVEAVSSLISIKVT